MRATAAPAGIIGVALLCSYKTGMAAFGGFWSTFLRFHTVDGSEIRLTTWDGAETL